jgi:hypothetical protein
VEDPTQPQTPEDISAQFTIQEGGYRLDRRTGFFVQSITITNAQDVPVPGPLYLLVEGLPSGINLVNASGISQNVSPGSPYVAIPLSVDGTNMRPGQSITMTFQFLNPQRSYIGYTPTIWRAAGVL